MAATHYVALNGPLPAGAEPGQTFPLLRWDGAGAAAHRYALAVADNDENDLAGAVLAALGFERDPNAAAGGGWRFYAVRPDGPLRPFDGTDHLTGLPPGAPPSGAGAGEAVVHPPASPVAVTSDLGDSDHDPSFAFGVFGLKLGPDGVRFGLGAAGGPPASRFDANVEGNQAALDQAQGAGQGVTLPDGLAFELAQIPGAPGLLTADARPVIDDGTGRDSPPLGEGEDDDDPAPDDPNEDVLALQLDLAGLSLRAPLAAGPDALEVDVDLAPEDLGDEEVNPNPPPGVPLGVAGGLVRFTLGPGGLRARLGPGRAPALALVLRPDRYEQINVDLRAEAGLIMGATSRPEDRAYLLPARRVETVDPVEFPISVDFALALPSWFRGPIARARFQPFRFDFTPALGNLPGVSLGVRAIDAVQAELGALDAGLADLLGGTKDQGSDAVTFRLETDLPAPTGLFTLADGPTLAVGMVVTFPRGSGRQRGSIRLSLGVTFDLLNFRIKQNRVHFLFGTDPANAHFVDLGVFAMAFPKRTEALDGEVPLPAGPALHDGWLDLERRELVVAPNAPADAAAAGEPGGFLPGREGLSVLVPGMMDDPDDGVVSRFRLTARRFSPDTWPEPPADPADNILFRVGARGLSIDALGTQQEVTLRPKGSDEIHDLNVQPEASRNGVRSELVVVDGNIRAADLFARMPLPGLSEVVAQLTVSIRQERRGDAPHVVAELELESSTKAPLADLDVGFLRLRLTACRLGLAWRVGDRAWDPSLVIDGTMSLAGSVGGTGGLDDLRKEDAIEVRDLDLLHLNRNSFTLGLKLARPVEFEFLGGLVLVRLEGLGFSWTYRVSATISCDRTLFRWKDPGTLEVSIGTGPVALVFLNPRDVRFRLDSRLSIEVRVKDSFQFQGELEWRDRGGKRFFAAGGTVSVAGLPGVTGFLKLGHETKRSGKRAASQAAFAGMDVDIDVFTGVTLKSFTGGIGYNNRLSALDDDPNADKLLAKIDTVHPESPDGWAFVERDGTYFSVVVQVAIGSNNGGPALVNAYIAQLVVSVDTDGVVAAAGRVWLFSSLDFTRSLANRDRPVLVGAMVFNPRRRALTVALETRPNPAIEVGDSLVAQALSGPLQASLRVRLTPQVADYFLERVQYSTDIVGITLLIRGSFRVAIFDDTLLVAAGLELAGGINLDLRAGPGGFRFHGDIRAAIKVVGVASARGLMTYGSVDFSADFAVSAFAEVRINLGFRKVNRRLEADFGALHVGVSGQGAFAESGAFGIRGSATVSVRICGRRFGMSAGFDYRGEVVDAVRREADRLIARLDQLVNEATGGGPEPSLPAIAAQAPAPAAASPTPPEVWLVLTPGDTGAGPARFALVPAGSGRWLAPRRVLDGAGPRQRLADDVRELRVEYQVGGGATQTKRVFMPWVDDADVPGLFRAAAAADRDARDELRELVLAGADPEGEAPAEPAIVGFLTDPRVRGDSSAFLDDDARVLTPEGADSFEFRDLSLLSDAEAAADPLASHPDFEQARAFDRARAETAATNRTRRDDRSDQEQAAAARAALAALVLDELGRRESPDRLTFDEPTPEGDAFGLVFRLPPGATITAVAAVRENDSTPQPVQLRRPGEAATGVTDGIALFRPRQGFRVTDDGRSGGGRTLGQVEVRLPFDLTDPSLVDPDDPRIDTFQVFRQFPWDDEPRLIAQGVRPVIVDPEPTIDPRPRLEPYLYRDVLPVLDGSFLVPGFEPGVTPVVYSVRAARPGESGVPPGFASDRWKAFPAVRLFVPPAPPFAGQLGLAFPAEALLEGDFPGRKADPGTFLLVDLSRPEPVPARGADGRRLKSADIELWAEETPLRQDGFLIGGEAERETSATGAAGAPRRLPAATLLQSIEGKFRVGLHDDDTLGGIVLDDPGRFQPGLGYRFYARPAATAARPGALLAPLEVAYLTRWPDAGEPLRLRGAEQFELASPGSVRPAEFLHRRDFTVAVGPDATPAANTLRAAWQSRSLLDGGVELLWIDRDDPNLSRRQLCEVMEEGLFRTSRSDFGKASGWVAVGPGAGGSPRPLPVPDPGGGQTPAAVFVPDPAADPVVRPLADLTTALVDLLDEGSEPWDRVAPTLARWSAAFSRYLVSPLNLDDALARDTDVAADEAVRLLFTGWRPPDDSSVNPARQDNDLKARLVEAVKELRAAVGRAIAPEEATAPPPGAGPDADLYAAVDARLSRQLGVVLDHRLNLAEELLAAQSMATLRTGADGTALPRLARWQEVAGRAEAAGGRSRLPRTYALLDAVWTPTATSAPGRLSPFDAFKQLAGRALTLAMTPADRRARLAGLAPEARGLHQVLDALPDRSTGEQVVRRSRHRLVARPGDGDGRGGRVAVPTPLESLLPDAWQTPGTLAELARRLAPVTGAAWTRAGAAITVTDEAHGLLAGDRVRVLASSDPAALPAGVDYEVATVPAEDSFILTGLDGGVGSGTLDYRPPAPAPLDAAAAASGAVAFFNVLERLGFAADVAVVDDGNRLSDQPALLRALEGAQVTAAIPSGHTLLAVAGQAPFSRFRPEDERVGYSFAKVAVVPDSFRQPEPAGDPAARRDWFVLRSFTPREPALFDACLWIVDQLARRLLAPAAPAFVFVEPVDEQWLTLPSEGGVSESYWTLPEGLGHVVTLKVRRVSRYEPLLTWAGLDPALVARAAPTLPAPSLDEVMREVEVARVFPEADSAADRDEPALAPVRTTAYPHPTLVRFSYQLPPDGARSLLNLVSATRTGFRGTDLGFGYALPEDPAGPDRARSRVMAAMMAGSTGLAAPRPVDARTALDVREAARPRLFRNERLVTLPDLPYCYAYTLSVRGAFQARRPGGTELSVLARPDAGAVAAERMPRLLAVPRPRLSVAAGPPLRITVELFLARHADFLIDAEAAAAPPALAFAYTPATGAAVMTAATDLPDLAARYTVIYLTAGDPAAPDPGDIYVQVASTTLPWSPFHGKAESPRPVVRAIHDKVRLADADATGGGRELTPRVEVLPGTPPAYRVTFVLEVEAGSDLLSEAGRAFVVVDRGGPESDRAAFEILIGGGS